MRLHNIDWIIESTKWAGLILFLVFLPLSKTSSIHYRSFVNYQVFELNKTSPSFAAHYDSNSAMEEIYENATDEMSLIAGDTSIDLMAMIAAVEVQTMPKNLVVSKAEKPIETVAVTEIEKRELPELNVATVDKLDVVEPSPLTTYSTDGELLPLKVRKSNLLDHFADFKIDLNAESWKDKAELLVRESKKDISSEQRIIYASDGSGKPKVIVRNPKPGNGVAAAGAKDFEDQAENRVIAKSTVPDNRFSFENLAGRESFTYIISGEVMLNDGLAFTGDNQLRIYHEISGEVLSDANLWLHTGKYEIVVERLEGYLVAELVSVDGDVLAAKEFDLYEVPSQPYNVSHIKDIDLVLSPFEKGINLEVISARSFKDHDIFVKDAKVIADEINREIIATDKKLFVDKEFLNGSNLSITASAKGYWDSLVEVISGMTSHLKLFPSSMINALFKNAEVKGPDANSGVIWGHVWMNGHPLQGASVEIAGEASAKPIYFKKLTTLIDLPDLKLELTSENGVFAFVNVPVGEYAIRVRHGNVYYPAQIVKVENLKVSYLPLEFGGLRSASLAVYDPISGAGPLAATINVYGADLEIDIEGTGKESVRFPTSNSQIMLEVDSGIEYVMTRTYIDKFSRHISAPVIPADWIQTLLKENKLVREEERGVIVGQVIGDDYTLYLNEELLDENVAVIYTDGSGNQIQAESGVAGGFFVIVNVPMGLQGLTLLSQTGKQLLQKTVYVEDKFVNSLQLKF